MTNFTNFLGRGSVDRPTDGDVWAWDEESGFSKPVAAAGGGGADFSLWSSDAPPAVPSDEDEEWWAQTVGLGVPTGFTAYDFGGYGTFATRGAGLSIISNYAPQPGSVNYILHATALLADHSYVAFTHQPDVVRRLTATVQSADPGMFTSIDVTLTGTDINDAPLVQTVTCDNVGDTATAPTAYKTITSADTSNLVGAITTELLVIGMNPAGPALVGVYKAIPAGDGSWTIKLCSGGETEASNCVGITFFEDATDPTKAVYVLGEHWFGDILKNAYDNWFTNASTHEVLDVASGYLRVRRAGTAYTLDYSGQGLSFGTSTDFEALDIGFVPQHIGIVVDNASSVPMGVDIAFMRYIAADVGLTAQLDGARVNGSYHA